ncbi:uncharacterized protein LOC101863364 isoform X2 [Aplysia californica]|uniref:Uncharacterized protein LOC101863364 isoform X2 n=1 Tax=Aplysia californica TaxID=6500 RepID=A0ABM1VXR4_APLCA|nr:uncharacterized protein LOC101863364 isoform X2 [Aplysia californica]
MVRCAVVKLFAVELCDFDSLSLKYTFGAKGAPSYRFYHWHLIDTFVYFSHRFITVPPLGWICAAHKEGVTVLGTVITEWDDGAKICQELLSSKSSIDKFTTKLAEIADFYNFDGWLINIENPIQPDQVSALQSFVSQLTEKCHAVLESPKVLWYDSVINTGELIWQDELNPKNEMFFDVCDGIFLNYLMTEEKLQRSKSLACKKGRQFDVYAGIDVFGRGTPCGGGFNCQEDLALIMSQGLSCAIFAQGWVFEHLGPESFDSNEIMFWGLLRKHLDPKPLTVPFSSSFCQGYGNKFFLNGQVIDSFPWQDLSLQQVQPNFTHSQFVRYTITKVPVAQTSKNKTAESKDGKVESGTDDFERGEPDQNATGPEATKRCSTDEAESMSTAQSAAVKDTVDEGTAVEKFSCEVSSEVWHPNQPKMEVDLSDAYQGGSCLRLSISNVADTGAQAVVFRLFKLHVEAATCKSLMFSVIWKVPSGAELPFGFVVSENSKDGNAKRVVVCTEQLLSSSVQQRLARGMISGMISGDAGVESGTEFHYVTCVTEAAACGWKQSAFSLDLDLLRMSGVLVFTEMTIGFLMVPFLCENRATCRHPTRVVQLGQIQVSVDISKESREDDPKITRAALVKAKVNHKLCSAKISDLVCHPSSSPVDGVSKVHRPAEGASLELDSDAIVSSRVILPAYLADVTTSSVVLSEQSIDLTEPESKDIEPYTLCFLQWEMPSGPVDYFLIYIVDEASNSQNLLGHSVLNSFVWKPSPEFMGASQKFFIHPIFTNTS